MNSLKSIFVFISMLVIVACVIPSCKKDTPNSNTYLGYSYYPDDVGRWIIYDVDSVFRDPFYGTTTRVHYQIKEIIDSVFSDNQGRPTLRLERYRNDSSPTNPEWIIYNVWTANRTASTVERFENNIRYIKLIFPLAEGKTWNGNSTNTFDEQDYDYEYIHQPENVNGLNFDSVANVLHVNDTDYNILFPRFEYEKFAAGVGMVEKRIQQIDYIYNGQTGKLDTSRYLYYNELIKSYGK